MRLIIFISCIVFLCSISAFAISDNSGQNSADLDTFSGAEAAMAAVDRAQTPSSGVALKTRTMIEIVGIGKNEVLDYKSQEFEHFDIQPIKQDMLFKKGLSVIQYDILITGWLNSIYLNRFKTNVMALRYFSRGLAEYAYSYNGYISTDFYNQMINRYKNYLTIDIEIEKLQLTTDIKYSLAKLYAAGCVYAGEVTSTSYAVDKISKIPKDTVLYHMQEQSGELYQEGKFSDAEAQDKPDDAKNLEKKDLGNFVGYDHGENLYYICLAYYPKFRDMPKSSQIKFVDAIYSYNPTLMLAPPVKRNEYAWNYFIDWIWPKTNPQLMKYCLKPYSNWVILPKTI
ncbi:MAG: hypothetical protein WCR55_03555 [Lentisphaerota bacterium]